MEKNMNDRDFFNSLADNWDSMCEHDADKIRYIIKLSGINKGSSILDVGTGTGVLVPFLLECSPSGITAIDLAENMIRRAGMKIKDPRVKFTACDLFEYDKGRFDYIFLYSVFPHFRDKKRLFKKLADLLKPNGKVIIAHSESRQAIDRVHSMHIHTTDHRLSSALDTAEIMGEWFDVTQTIDDKEMYYISAVKL